MKNLVLIPSKYDITQAIKDVHQRSPESCVLRCFNALLEPGQFMSRDFELANSFVTPLVLQKLTKRSIISRFPSEGGIIVRFKGHDALIIGSRFIDGGFSNHFDKPIVSFRVINIQDATTVWISDRVVLSSHVTPRSVGCDNTLIPGLLV